MKSLSRKSISTTPQLVVNNGVRTAHRRPGHWCNLMGCRGRTEETVYKWLRLNPDAPHEAVTYSFTFAICRECGDVQRYLRERIHYNRRLRCVNRHLTDDGRPPLLDRPGESPVCAYCRQLLRRDRLSKRHRLRKNRRNARAIVENGIQQGMIFCPDGSKRQGPCIVTVKRKGERCDWHKRTSGVVS